MAFLLVALRLGQNARLQAQHAVGHHQGGQLAAGEHIVPNADLLVGYFLNHPLVHPLVMAAHQQKPIVLRQALCLLLGIGLARRRKKNDPGPRAALLLCLAQHVHTAVINGLGIHHHAAAAAVGVVVHLALPVQRVIPDLVAMGLDQALAGRAPQNALVQHALAHLGEQGRHVDAHHALSPSSAVSNIPRIGRTSTRRPSTSTCSKNGFTAGNSQVSPCGPSTV